MSDNMFGAVIGLRAAQTEMRSALPEAPVVRQSERQHRVTVGRLRIAAGLHRLAGWVEPRDRRVRLTAP